MIKDSATTSRNIEQAYNNKKYIVSYDKVYQPMYSQAQGQFYAIPVYTSKGNMTLRGRYFHMTGQAVNHLIGYELLAEL